LNEFRSLISAHLKALGLVVVIVLALVSGVYAYWKLNNPSQSSPATSTFISYPIEFGMELNNTGFAVGESVAVRLYLKNISNRSVVVSFITSLALDFIVKDTNGASVYIWSFWKYFLAAPMSKLLHPCEALNRTLWWEQTYSSPDFLDKYQQTVPSGRYFIEGLTAPSFTAFYWDGETPVESGMYYQGESTGVKGVLSIPKITITTG